jgi:hypothetical protein
MPNLAVASAPWGRSQKGEPGDQRGTRHAYRPHVRAQKWGPKVRDGVEIIGCQAGRIPAYLAPWGLGGSSKAWSGSTPVQKGFQGVCHDHQSPWLPLLMNSTQGLGNQYSD